MPEKEGSGKRAADRILERYLLDELSARERRRVEGILERDPATAARLEALKRSNEEILASYPPGEMAEKIRVRGAAEAIFEAPPAKQRRSGFRLPSFALPLAAAALILIVILPLRSPLSSRDEVRAKGLEAGLKIYRQEEDGGEPLASGTLTAAGDLLQLAYVSGGSGYGVILSIDGRGTVTFHYPPSAGESPAAGGAAPPLKPGGATVLPYAYQLDDAPVFERFFLVSSEEPFDLAPVRRAAERLAADPAAARRQSLALPGGLDQASLLLLKEGAP